MSHETDLWLSFKVGDQWFAQSVIGIRDIVPCPEINPVPGADLDVVGIVDVRGTSIVVHDLARLMSAPPIEDSPQLLTFELEDSLQAIRITEAGEIFRAPQDSIESVGNDREGVRGTILYEDQQYIVLDLMRLLEPHTSEHDPE